METLPKEWLEGPQAFMDGIDEDGCPYRKYGDLRRWSNWVSGHGEAKHEYITQRMHAEARAELAGRNKRFSDEGA